MEIPQSSLRPVEWIFQTLVIEDRGSVLLTWMYYTNGNLSYWCFSQNSHFSGFGGFLSLYAEVRDFFPLSAVNMGVEAQGKIPSFFPMSLIKESATLLLLCENKCIFGPAT